MMAYTFRALEMHGRRMWERARIVEALDFIVAHDMTALVLHESDLIQQITFPSRYFDPYAQWASAPTRRGENAIQNNRVYIDHILHLAKSRGVEVWIEVKELAFPDEVLEARPHLIKNGVVCPSDPFWMEFIEHKTAELFDDFPLLAGMIVSPGSPEGRASRAQNKCMCEVCAGTSLTAWYGGIIAALHRPTARHGKRLAIRDFAYKPADHEPLIEAIHHAPKDVIFCIKATPHDFYPTFPDNPAFGRTDREQWIEYDTQGQFYGWGILPCFMHEDIVQRLVSAEARGITGGLFRTEWERVNDWWSLESLNVLNLYTAASYARGERESSQALCRRWLDAHNWPAELAPWLDSVLSETWPIIKHALYIDDFVFADCSMFPRSVGRAWWTMEVKHSLHVWDPERSGDLDLSQQRMSDLLTEKAWALQAARQLAERVEAGAPGLPPALHTMLLDAFRFLVPYVEGLALCADVCLHARWQQTKPHTAIQISLEMAIGRLRIFGQGLRPLAEEALYPHHITMLLDYRRIEDIAREAERIMVSAAGTARMQTAQTAEISGS
jgi:hypothetical protein